MKKFFITLLILIIFGGAGFIIGWVQLTVPPASYGVILSKTHGVDPQPVRAGEFRWLWYKLIPTNVQIPVFKLESSKYPLNFNSSLPSGDVYATFAGLISSDFSWNLNGEISFALNPDMLIPIVTRQNLSDQASLDAYLQEIAQGIRVIILGILSSPETDNLRLENILSGSPDPELEQDVLARYPEIIDFSFVISSARYPDFVLYRQVRMLYEEFLTKQREFIATAFSRRAENHIQAQLHFIELERYGELLTKYPVLLDYLALENSKN